MRALSILTSSPPSYPKGHYGGRGFLGRRQTMALSRFLLLAASLSLPFTRQASPARFCGCFPAKSACAFAWLLKAPTVSMVFIASLDAGKFGLGFPVVAAELAAGRTGLAGVLRRHRDQHAAVPSLFIIQLPAEFTPALVQNRRQVQVILQILRRDVMQPDWVTAQNYRMKGFIQTLESNRYYSY
jgi:hypothetical protein